MKGLTLAALLAATLTVQSGDWAQCRGPKRDGHAAPGEKLPDKLPAEFSPIWKIPSGGGFSSPVIAGDKVVYMGGDGTQEVAHCLDAKTGKELWKQSIAEQYTDEW